jgi:hypothetical protein
LATRENVVPLVVVPGARRFGAWPSFMMKTALAPLARALIAFSTKLQPPRWTSAMLPDTAAGKSLMAQPARVPSWVPTGGMVIRLTGMTCPVISADRLHVICAKSPVLFRAFTNVFTSAAGAVCSSTAGVRSDHAFGADVLA